MADNVKGSKDNKDNTPAASTPPEKAQTPAPTADFVTRDEAVKMAAEAAEKATESTAKLFAETIKDVMARMPQQVAQAAPAAPVPQAGHTIMITPPKDKPNLPSKLEVPKEFWNEKGLTVFHAGDQFCMDGFRIDGRLEPPPRSKLIFFRPGQLGGEVKRFGDVAQITNTCQYTTHDQREIDLFHQDIGWGTEYWDGSGRLELDAQLQLGMIMGNKMNALSGTPFEELRQMSIQRKLKIGSKQFMAANIAAHDSKKETESLAEKAAARLKDASAEIVLNDAAYK